MMIQRRDIAVCIILSIVTCGIYTIYWWIKVTDEMNDLSAASNSSYTTSGALSFILTLVTCGIYGFYWAFKMGEKLDSIGEGSNNAILFLILQLFGLGIVSMALMQSTLNKYADA